MATLRKLVVVGFAILALTGAAATAGSARTATNPQAAAYFKAHQDTIYRVAAAVLRVQYWSHQNNKIRTRASLERLLSSLDRESAAVDKLHLTLAPSETGTTLGGVEQSVYVGSGALRDALGRLAAYLRDPGPAASATFVSRYSAASGDWNYGVRVLWSYVHKDTAPVVPASL